MRDAMDGIVVPVCILDRPRHDALVADVRTTGARIQFISDGDVAGAPMACSPGSGVEAFFAVTGSTDGEVVQGVRYVAGTAVGPSGPAEPGIALARVRPSGPAEPGIALARVRKD